MYRSIVFVAALLAPMPAFAAETSDVLMITDSRYFLIELDANDPTIRELKKVIRVDVDDEQPQPPTDPNGVEDQVAELTQATGEPLFAHGIADGVYKTVREMLEKDEISWNQAMAMIKAGTDIALRESENAAAWTTLRTELASLIDELQKTGKLDTKDEQLAFLFDVETGMKNAFPAEGLDVLKLIEFIRMLIEFLQSLKADMVSINDGGGVFPMLQSKLYMAILHSLPVDEVVCDLLSDDGGAQDDLIAVSM